jgi:hypothetical protein
VTSIALRVSGTPSYDFSAWVRCGRRRCRADLPIRIVLLVQENKQLKLRGGNGDSGGESTPSWRISTTEQAACPKALDPRDGVQQTGRNGSNRRPPSTRGLQSSPFGPKSNVVRSKAPRESTRTRKYRWCLQAPVARSRNRDPQHPRSHEQNCRCQSRKRQGAALIL